MEYKDLKPEMSGKECLIDFTLYDDNDVPAILVLYDAKWYACQDALNGIPIPDKHGKKYSYCLDSYNCSNIRLKHRTILEAVSGDVIVNKDGRRKVLARINDIIFVSYYDNFEKSQGAAWTIKEIEEQGFVLEQIQTEQEEVVVTMDEIARMKGVDVSRIKVKKN